MLQFIIGQSILEAILDESGYDIKHLTGLCGGKKHDTGCIFEYGDLYIGKRITVNSI